MVFVTAGMGGGTGTGAAPVVASCVAHEGILSIAVALTPFSFEGRGKIEMAAAGLAKLRDAADSVIVVSNEKLDTVCDEDASMVDAFGRADSVLIQGVRGLSDFILRPGIVNGDFSDVRAVLCESGEALIGTGEGKGKTGIKDALRKALDCPLMERERRGPATKVLVSITANWAKVPLSAYREAMKFLSEHYSQPDIKPCKVEAPEEDDRILVTILASGFSERADAAAFAAPPIAVAPAQAVAPTPREVAAPHAAPTVHVGDLRPPPGRGRRSMTQAPPPPSPEGAGATQGNLNIPTWFRNHGENSGDVRENIPDIICQPPLLPIE
jgi:cell division protein FtsZ